MRQKKINYMNCRARKCFNSEILASPLALSYSKFFSGKCGCLVVRVLAFGSPVPGLILGPGAVQSEGRQIIL